MTPPSHIRRATLDEAAALSAFAARAFRDTFGADNSPEDMDAYVAATFSPELQAAEIADPRTVVLVVDAAACAADSTMLTGSFAGYAQLCTSVAPAEVDGAAPIELQRFYIASEWHGSGLAQALMREVLRVAATRDARTLWLGVWERNHRALAFYTKAGFTRVGSHGFQLGSDLQTDLLFARPVPRLDAD